MGIIKKQTLQGSIINYIGVLIGFITVGILSPKIDSKYIGLVSVIVSYSIIISQIGSLGFPGITTRLFAYFRTKDNKHNGFLFVAVSVSIVGFILASLIVLAIRYIAYSNRQADDLFIQYYWYIIPVTFFTIFFNLFDNYYKVLFNAVKGIFLKELVQKIGTFTALLMIVSGFINFKTFVFVYLTGYSLPGILIIINTIIDKKNNFSPNLKFIKPELKKSIISVGLFSIISGASGIVAMNIDKIMIEAITGLSDTGIYSVAFYFGVIIAIPARSMLKISSALIAENWKNNDIENIRLIYQKSAINLFVVGLLLVIGLYINLDNILVLLKGNYANGKYVILFIASAFLFDMLAGTAGQILFTSPKYKYQSYLMILYVILIVTTNLLLIPEFGINGAAAATLISKILINFIRFIVNLKLFKLQPYNYKFLILLLIGGIVLIINVFIDKQGNFIADIVLRSVIIGGIYLLLIYIFKISDDINKQITSLLRNLKILK